MYFWTAGRFRSDTLRFKAWCWPCVLMFRLALSSRIYFLSFRDTNPDTLSHCSPRHVLWQRVFRGASEFKCGTWYSERITLQFMCVGCWAGVTHLRYAVLTIPKKDETAVHCCNPALSVLISFDVSKRFLRSISLAVYCLSLNSATILN